MIRNIKFLPLFAAVLLSACKKETKKTPGGATEPEVVTVLNNNSGFSASADILVKLTEMNTGSQGSLGLYDFTIDNDNHLNIYYYDEWQSQQDKIKTDFRKSFDFSTKKEIAVTEEPNRAFSMDGFKAGTIEYMPYSNKLVSFGYTDNGSGYYARAFLGGALSSDLPFGPGWQGNYSGGFGYYNGYAEQKLNGGLFYLSVQLLASSPVLANYQYLTPTFQGLLALGYEGYNSHLIANFPEPRHLPGQGQSVIVSVCADSVTAYKINNVMSPAKVYTKTGHLANTGITLNKEYKYFRHYNADGSKMAMLVQNMTTKNVWTYTYDFRTDQLSANLSNVSLAYADAGSDMDMDEDGNVYYSGIAGNGNNSNGVTIYKRTQSGTTMVGADNFLKFGEVTRLKYLKGKVHMVVKGNITGYKAWAQLTVLSQQ